MIFQMTWDACDNIYLNKATQAYLIPPFLRDGQTPCTHFYNEDGQSTWVSKKCDLCKNRIKSY